ncbi:GroES-like protein [Trichoderma camerunense]
MKEATVNPDLSVTIHDNVSLPRPSATQVLIRIVCSGFNPKDWKEPYFHKIASNSGDDMAGYVESVGEDVVGVQVGDKVAAFHTMRTLGGSFAEFGLAESSTTFLLPKHLSFEEASTIPLCAYTAAVALFARLKLPMPWAPPNKPTPLIIYGASSAVGAFAIKLARHAGIYPIIAVAGSGHAYVETLLDKSRGDSIVDYRNGNIHEDIRQALDAAGTHDVYHAIDAICENDSHLVVSRALSTGGNIALINPGLDYSDIRNDVNKGIIYVGVVNGNVEDDKRLAGIEKRDPIPHRRDFSLVWSTLFSRGLYDGWLTAHPYELVPGGLEGVSTALNNLKAGKASAKKYVVRIAEN